MVSAFAKSFRISTDVTNDAKSRDNSSESIVQRNYVRIIIIVVISQHHSIAEAAVTCGLHIERSSAVECHLWHWSGSYDDMVHWCRVLNCPHNWNKTETKNEIAVSKLFCFSQNSRETFFSCFSQSQPVSAVYAKLLHVMLLVKLQSTNMEIICVTSFGIKSNQLLKD